MNKKIILLSFFILGGLGYFFTSYFLEEGEKIKENHLVDIEKDGPSNIPKQIENMGAIVTSSESANPKRYSPKKQIQNVSKDMKLKEATKVSRAIHGISAEKMDAENKNENATTRLNKKEEMKINDSVVTHKGQSLKEIFSIIRESKITSGPSNAKADEAHEKWIKEWKKGAFNRWIRTRKKPPTKEEIKRYRETLNSIEEIKHRRWKEIRLKIFSGDNHKKYIEIRNEWVDKWNALLNKHHEEYGHIKEYKKDTEISYKQPSAKADGIFLRLQSGFMRKRIRQL